MRLRRIFYGNMLPGFHLLVEDNALVRGEFSQALWAWVADQLPR